MKKTLEKYKSLEERNLSLLKKQLQDIQLDIEETEKSIRLLSEKLQKFDYTSLGYISDFNLANSYIENIRKQIANSKEKLNKLYKEEEKIKSQIAQLNAQIKAVEKYIEKIEKKEIKENLKKEVALIDEIFNRRFTNS